MVEMTLVYTGKKHCDITHAPSNAVISTDAPKDNHGLGQAFSPTDLTAASLGSCMLTVMGIQADLKGWDMNGSSAHVIKEMTTNPRRIAKLTVHLKLPDHLDQAARSHLEKTASGCPVKYSLHPEIIFDIKFNYVAISR